MKNSLLIAALIFATSTWVQAKSLSCQSLPRPGNSGIAADDMTLQLTAKMIDQEKMMDVVATVNAPDFTTPNNQGKLKEFYPDKNYNPRKYDGYERYDLSQLVDTKDSSKFIPADYCQFQVMIPGNVDKLASFKAPVLIHCDQSGGKMTLSCVVR